MDSILSKLENLLTPLAMKINQNRYLGAVKDGLIGAMSFIILGSMFLLVANLPIDGYPELMASILGENWQSYFTGPYEMTMNIMTLYIILPMARSLSNYYKLNTLGGTLGSLAGFLILTPSVIDVDGNAGIAISNLGAAGLFLGMITVILSVEIYRFVVERGWVIKMPDAVPQNVTASFSALIPTFFIMLIFGLMRIGFTFTQFNTAQSFIFNILQQPLTSLGGTLPAMIFGILFETILWSLGIHGSSLHRSVMEPIWFTLTAENLQDFQAGSVPQNIINYQFYSNYVKVGGVGATFGLMVCCLFFAKSKQLKSIGGLSAAPAFFNINEPITFGVPIVLNPIMIVPFVLTPTILAILTYAVTVIGILPPANGTNIPFTTPPIVAGFLVSGWRGAVWQVVEILISIGIYYPFFRIQDNTLYENEQAKSEDYDGELAVN